MIETSENKGVFLANGELIIESNDGLSLDDINTILSKNGLDSVSEDEFDITNAREKTISYGILKGHNHSGDISELKIQFDAMASHDITYVGIIQTARASGLKEFPLPYALTNCHNSLSAVGGTINEDDHAFGLSAAIKYGGIFVPPHQAVIHQYVREMLTGCGKMILGSDSHTRYGAFGTMGFGEGGPELVKQLLKHTYDIKYPEIIAIYLDGAPVKGVGPQDIALTLIKEVFSSGYVKNKVMEFIGPGIKNLSVDFRTGIDVMTTETTCLSSIWQTDDKVQEYYKIHGRPEEYVQLQPGKLTYYDGLVKIDLGKIEPMIAMPFHPSNAYSIKEVIQDPVVVFKAVEKYARSTFGDPELDTGLTEKIKDGRILVNQGIIAGCSGGSFENICHAADILEGTTIGDDEFNLSVYPASQPINLEIIRTGVAERLMINGAVMRSAFCGPCFGAGDTPAHKDLSIRHTTRNFPNREGSKPQEKQLSYVALMDARSIAATAMNKGYLTPATEISKPVSHIPYTFNIKVYQNRVKDNIVSSKPQTELRYGPNIKDWPEMIALPENLLLSFASVIHDPVTTTDELIPSGETSSFRSNPMRLAEFTLSRKDPEYVERAKHMNRIEHIRQDILKNNSEQKLPEDIERVISRLIENIPGNFGTTYDFIKNTGFGSLIFAVKPGDGSAREQAASCQKVLGGWANMAIEYATKRYRSNVINWGMIPFTIDGEDLDINAGDHLYIPSVRSTLKKGGTTVQAYIIKALQIEKIDLAVKDLTSDEKDIILSGSLINYYADGN